MRAKDFITEKWSNKYKRSINCNNPKGFSQRAHCQGRKKTNESATDIPKIGINIRSDGDIHYADLIVDGKKYYESRKGPSLNPYIGKRVGIIRTGAGKAIAIGAVTVGEPIVVDEIKFRKLQKMHRVPPNSKFDIVAGQTKYLYPMIDPVRFDKEYPVGLGIVARRILDEGKFPFKNKNKIYNLLVNATDSGPFDGGCVVFAQALQQKYGGEIVVLIADTPYGKRADHAALMLNNGQMMDADGVDTPERLIKRFTKNENLLYPIIGYRPIKANDLPDAPRNNNLAKLIAKLL